jgi:hypothetical protein
MKLSIWQQFSSNHSNDFTIVGRFASSDDAVKAQERFQEILKLMMANAQKDEANKILKVQMMSLGMGWEHERLPDWLDVNVAPVEVLLYDNILFVDVYNNWSSHQPLDLLLDKLGSENTETDSEMGRFRPVWTFDFDILDSEKADVFEKIVLGVLTVDKAIIHHKDYQYPDNRMGVVDWRGEEEYGAFTIKLSRQGFHFQLADVDFWLGRVDHKFFSSFSNWLKDAGATNIHPHGRNMYS